MEILNTDSISKFYEDVARLKLRFPIAEIHRKTGFSKGNVSEIINRQREPSENFLKKFYENFEIPVDGEGESQTERAVKFRLNLKHNRKPIPVTNVKAAAGTIQLINDEPELILEYLDAPFIGPVEGVIEVVGDSMSPTFKPGARIAVTRLTDPQLIYWGEYYYVIDKNYQGVVKRLYAGITEDYIVLKSDNPDQDTYPPVTRRWEQIEAVFKVKADITKH